MRQTFDIPRLSDNCIRAVRQGMLHDGFAVVDLPHGCDRALLRRLRQKRLVLPYTAKRLRSYPELLEYAVQMECLLNQALPEEAVHLVDVEFRHEPAGSTDDEVDRLHADGSYIRSVCALYGSGTIYRSGKTVHATPEGKTLLLTALHRARAVGVPCTLHRRPGVIPERVLMVCSFEP